MEFFSTTFLIKISVQKITIVIYYLFSCIALFYDISFVSFFTKIMTCFALDLLLQKALYFGNEYGKLSWDFGIKLQIIYFFNLNDLLLFFTVNNIVFGFFYIVSIRIMVVKSFNLYTLHFLFWKKILIMWKSNEFHKFYISNNSKLKKKFT